MIQLKTTDKDVIYVNPDHIVWIKAGDIQNVCAVRLSNGDTLACRTTLASLNSDIDYAYGYRYGNLG